MFWLRTFSNWTRKTVQTNWGNNGQYSCSPSVWQQFGPVGREQVEQHGSFNINRTLNYLKWLVVKNSGLLHSWRLQGNTLTRYLILEENLLIAGSGLLRCWLVLSLPVADVSPLPRAVSLHHPGRAGGSRAEPPHLPVLHAGLRPHGTVHVRGSRLQPRAVRAAAGLFLHCSRQVNFWQDVHVALWRAYKLRSGAGIGWKYGFESCSSKKYWRFIILQINISHPIIIYNNHPILHECMITHY